MGAGQKFKITNKGHHRIYLHNVYFCLAFEAKAKHMYCFSGVHVVVVGSGDGGIGVNFCRVFAFRSFSKKL